MAARLTDRKRKKIIADYTECGSYAATARKNGVSDKTVKAVVMADPETTRISEQKKKKNTLDMLAFMDSRKRAAQDVIDVYLKALADPDKLDSATLAQVATALGIVVDKFTRTTSSGNESMIKLDGLLREFQDAVKSETN